MSPLRVCAILSCLGISLAFTPASRADEWNKKTQLTVNEPLMIPGATLQPGKYVVQLVDSPSNRHIVRFTNEDESQTIATVLAIPNQRLQPTGETQFGFWEMPAGQPRALRAWFYPGDNFGQEFAYPEQAAKTIASAARESVPAVVSESADLGSAQVERITPEGQREQIAQSMEQQQQPELSQQSTQPMDKDQKTTQPMDESEITAQQQAQQQQPEVSQQQQPQVSQQTETETQTTTRTQTQTQTTIPDEDEALDAETARQADGQAQLPLTGSPLPLIGLAGLLALGGGVVLRRLG